MEDALNPVAQPRAAPPVAPPVALLALLSAYQCVYRCAHQCVLPAAPLAVHHAAQPPAASHRAVVSLQHRT